MQKKLFLILCGLLLLISFQSAQSFGQDGPVRFNAPAAPAPSPSGRWSAPSYHPENGDKIVAVNRQIINDENDFRRAIRNSPREIILGVIDKRSGQYYHLRTYLWSPESQTRLGISVVTSRYRDGVIVTGCMPGSPGMSCQYLRGEISPVFEGGYWWY